jgi:hypothetical protein
MATNDHAAAIASEPQLYRKSPIPMISRRTHTEVVSPPFDTRQTLC